MNGILYVGKHTLTYNVQKHEHTTWELIYCTEGNGIFSFADGPLAYSAGDVVIIPPSIPHTNNSETGFTNIHVNLSDTTLTTKKPVLIHDDSNEFLLHAFTAAYYHFNSTSPYRSALLSAYGNLLACYMMAYQQTPSHSRVVEEIENHIIHHYPDCQYELDTYLRSFPFSYDYLRKLFKKELGVTPHKYLMDLRLQAAADRLSSIPDDNNITEISRLCGFKEPLYFSRMFKKKYGVAPSFYFEESQKQTSPTNSEDVKVMLD